MVLGNPLTIHFAQDKPVFYGISTDLSRKNGIIYNLIGLGTTPNVFNGCSYFSMSEFKLQRILSQCTDIQFLSSFDLPSVDTFVV